MNLISCILAILLPLMNLFASPLDRKRSLADQLPDLANYIRGAAWFHYLPGHGPAQGQAMNAAGTARRRYLFNHSIIELYRFATHSPSPNRLVLEVRDAGRYHRCPGLPFAAWAPGRVFSYEREMPTTAAVDDFRAAMRRDLDEVLRVRGRLEKRWTDCWVLRVAESRRLPLAGAGTFSPPVDLRSGYRALNRPVSDLVRALNRKPQAPIVLDETRLRLPLDLDFHVEDLHHTGAVDEQLRTVGLELLRQRRLIDRLVLTEMN